MVGFDVTPIVLNEAWKPALAVTTVSGDGWKMVSHDHIGSPMVRQGCVLYPLDLWKIYEDGDSWTPSTLSGTPLIIDMPIGTVSVSTSREQIGYDAETTKNLRERFTSVIAGARAEIQKSLDAYDDYHDACEAFATISDDVRKLTGYKSVWRETFTLRKKFTVNGRASAGALRASLILPDTWVSDVRFVSRKEDEILPSELRKAVVLREDVGATVPYLRVRAFMTANPGRTVVWAKGMAARSPRIWA